MQNKKSLLQRLLVIYITFFIVLVASIAHGIQRYFLIDGAGVEGFVNILKLQHTAEPPLA